MGNSSTTTQSLPGNLLVLSRATSGSAIARREQESGNFTDTFSSVRKDVVSDKPGGRLTPRQPAEPSASRSEKPIDRPESKSRPAEVRPREPARPHQAEKRGGEDSGTHRVERNAAGEKTTAKDDDQQAVPGQSPDEEPAVLDTHIAPPSLPDSETIAAMATDETEGVLEPDAELTEVDATEAIAGNFSAAESSAVTPVLAAGINASASSGNIATGSGSSNRLTTGHPLQSNALAMETIAGEGDGELNFSGKSGEMTPDNLQKEVFAKLFAASESLAQQVDRKVTPLGQGQSSSTAGLEAMARAAESLAPAARTFVVQTGVAPQVGHPQWSQAVGDRVLWLAAQNITTAELRLDPPELGPMQVRVTVQQDQVQVNFTSPHAAVREALDQGAARLREMFNEQGLNVNVDVSDQSLARRDDGEETSGGRNDEDAEGEPEGVIAETSIRSLRLIDHYA